MASEVNNYVGEDFLQYLYILDSTYTPKMLVDTFSDLLWTERYCGYGEFEITMPVNDEILANCLIGDYISIRESSKIMIVETISIHSDYENGDTIKISGKTLESLLDRRIILDETIGTINEDGSANKIGLQTAISTIVNNNVVNPSNANRKIPNFSFKNSSDSKITALTLESFESRGENVYEKIRSICEAENLGFRVNAVDGGGYQFELYFGIDRSWDQTDRMAVVFSDSYDNLTNSDYLKTYTNYKTSVYVFWRWSSEREVTDPETEITSTERESGTDVTEVNGASSYTGLNRRESFMNDSNTYDIGPDKNKTAAINQVTDRGKEYLSDYKTTEYFDGEVEPYRQFTYGEDYVLGDIVQLANKYGKTGKCRITELVLSRDSAGPSIVPTFETVEGDE